MFYITDRNTDQILETRSTRPSAADVQADAIFFGCSVYVIEGQEIGLEADANQPTEAEQHSQ